jgi:carboxypeptidase Taq
MKDLEIVKKYQREILLIGKSLALLGWDQQVYMPEKGVDSRAEQTCFLSSLLHKKMISDEFFNSLKKLKKKNLKGDDKIMVEKVYQDVLKSRKIPEEFVEELSKVEALAFSAWQEAKKKKNFKIFQPHLEKLVELKKREANYLGFSGSPYNALLDGFEEGMTVEILKPKFDKLKYDLIQLIKKIENSKNYKKITKDKIEISKQDQMKIVEDVSKRIGLMKEFSRVDFAEHPFTTTIGFNDVRITTNIRDDVFFSFTSTTHESGHALYELQMPEKHKFDFLKDSPSFGLHESQSRLWENMIGKSDNFWKFYYKKFNKFSKMNKNKDYWYHLINRVFPGKVRIESDEVHYCLHVILRFEIEIGLIEGSIKVKDLPKIWNEKTKEFFGVVPENDSEGVLQDVHWSGGSFGYFPTYALGTIYAAQIYEIMKKQIPNLEKQISRGDFSKIRVWLKENIHKFGRKYLAEDLIKKVTGEGLNPEIYVKYLNEKYSKIYDF